MSCIEATLWLSTLTSAKLVVPKYCILDKLIMSVQKMLECLSWSDLIRLRENFFCRFITKKEPDMENEFDFQRFSWLKIWGQNSSLPQKVNICSLISLERAWLWRLIRHYETKHIQLTLLHSERPKPYEVLAFLSAIGLRWIHFHVKLLGHFLWGSTHDKEFAPTKEILSFKSRLL